MEYKKGDRIKRMYLIRVRDVRIAYRIIVGRPEDKRLLERPRR
jgi:hypothetical protein